MDASVSEQLPAMVCMSQDADPNEVDEVTYGVEMETGLDGANLEGADLCEVDAEDFPQSPASSFSFDDTGCLPSSDVIPPDAEQHDAHPPELASKQEHPTGSDVEKLPYRTGKQKRIGKVEIGTDDDDSSEERGESRSATASRKLKESLKSGQFVVNERKRASFEGKCKRMDSGARFRYGEKWEVLHQKCGKWATMTEPYNTTRFKTHLNTCKSKGTKGRNSCIDDFFRPRVDSECMGASAKSTKQPVITARNQVVIGHGCSVKADPETPPVITESLPCLGLREEHNHRIPKYISRALTEGAGSQSESRITAQLFGDGTRYSELGDKGRCLVQAAQVHARAWIINRELRAIYSTNCRKSINAMSTESTCPECLGVLGLGAFKKALNVEPVSLASKKYTPYRWRTAATDLAINLSEINGLPGLLEAVSPPSPICPPSVGDQLKKTRTPNSPNG